MWGARIQIAIFWDCSGVEIQAFGCILHLHKSTSSTLHHHVYQDPFIKPENFHNIFCLRSTQSVVTQAIVTHPKSKVVVIVFFSV